MKRNYRKLTRVIMLMALTLTGSGSWFGIAQAAELRVPAVYPTISEAIQAAANGDEIVLADNANGYSGAGNVNLVISGKQLTIRPEGIAAVTINCQGSSQGYFRAFTIEDNAHVTLKRLNIRSGYHSVGGALVVDDAVLTMENCYIADCLSTATGGAISINGSSAGLSATDCWFDLNHAEANGGAVFVGDNLPVVFSGCTFSDNTSADRGGAISLENNEAGILIDACSFTGNYTWNQGGAVYADAVNNITVSNCLFAGNYADSHGGGVYLSNSPFSTGNEDNKIINCTITENRSNANGGGLRLFDSELILANSVVYGNIVGQDDYGYQGEYSEIAIVGENSYMAFAHNIIQGGLDPAFVNEYVFLETGSLAVNRGGNLDVNPGFTETGFWLDQTFQAGNYKPHAGSFCYNSGKNSYSELFDADIDGNARLADTYVDIGCYETQDIPAGVDITGTATATMKFPLAIIPGDKGKVAVTISNIGSELLTGEMGIKLYYSTDAYISADDTQLYVTAKDLKLKMLAAGKTIKKYSYAFTVPSTMAAGSYHLLVHLDYANKVSETDESIYSNVLDAGLHEIYWKFGTFNGRNNAVLIIPDRSDILNSYSIKNGEGQIAADRSTITLVGNSEATTMTVATKTKGATATLGDITCTGSFSLNAAKCNLGGDITVSGIMPKLTVNNISNSIITIAGSSSNAKAGLTLIAGSVSNSSLLCDNLPINTIKVKGWLNTGQSTPLLSAPWIKTLTCTGDFKADVTLSGVNAVKNIAMTSAAITGNIQSCRWLINGSVGKFSAASLSNFDLYLGTAPDIEEPTGNESDFASQCTINLAVKNAGLCLVNTRIMSYAITSASFNKQSTADGNSIVEYYYTPKTLNFPTNTIVMN